MLKDELIKKMKSIFGSDEKRIRHALNVLNYAEQIQLTEGGDLFIITASAILHDIGIHEAERKHGSNAGKYQEIEGPPIAADVLKNYDLEQEIIDKICLIIANHHSAKDTRINDTAEFKIIWDADWLVNIPDEYPDLKQDKLSKIIYKVFKTEKGRQLAMDRYL
ncbi:MAG: HD domain-containing protein [Sedimentisphaerales bacterium]|nr:HD domain-containing protein [Sedimentisphaerales bacterium]